MKFNYKKRQRIAKIFGRVAEYTVSIIILGSIVTEKINIFNLILGFLLFTLFFMISVVSEPTREAE